MTQNKKRKQSSPIYSDHHDYHHRDGKMVDDQENIESVLFEGMTEVNSKLISLGNNFNLVDNLYFMNNNNMIDEFIGNIQQFMKQLELHRNKVAFSNINSDILMNVYQFLDSKTLKNCCGLVCKLWKESLTGLKVIVKTKHATKLLESSIINYVTEMRLIALCSSQNDMHNTMCVSAFKSLSNCKKLNQLKRLDLSDNNLNSECVKYLMNSSLPNLTHLKFNDTYIDEKDAIDLFNNNFMSNIKKLDLSYTIEDFTNNFYESICESKYLNQITHLKIYNEQPQIVTRIDLLLKNMINLEHLSLSQILLINGNYKNLKYLNISYCKLKVQEFVNLFFLPKLEIIKAEGLKWADEIDNTVALFPPNSQSSITELALTRVNLEQFPSLFNHCTKLKKLKIDPKNFLINPHMNKVSAEEEKVFIQLMKSPGLSTLECLDISPYEIVEEIFINPIYSNLKELHIGGGEINMDDVKLLSNCTNLVNLTCLCLHDIHFNDFYESSLIEEYSKALKNNPTFSKLKCIQLPECGETDDDED